MKLLSLFKNSIVKDSTVKNGIVKNCILLILLSAISISAHTSEQTNDKPNILLHVTTSSIVAHQAALNNANALLKTYGKDNINIEIVANGSGVGIANSKNKISSKVISLLDKGVRLSVCNASINMMKKHGKTIPLLHGVVHVSNGITRVVELQQQGYIYVKP